MELPSFDRSSEDPQQRPSDRPTPPIPPQEALDRLSGILPPPDDYRSVQETQLGVTAIWGGEGAADLPSPDEPPVEPASDRPPGDAAEPDPEPPRTGGEGGEPPSDDPPFTLESMGEDDNPLRPHLVHIQGLRPNEMVFTRWRPGDGEPEYVIVAYEDDPAGSPDDPEGTEESEDAVTVSAIGPMSRGQLLLELAAETDDTIMRRLVEERAVQAAAGMQALERTEVLPFDPRRQQEDDGTLALEVARDMASVQFAHGDLQRLGPTEVPQSADRPVMPLGSAQTYDIDGRDWYEDGGADFNPTGQSFVPEGRAVIARPRPEDGLALAAMPAEQGYVVALRAETGEMALLHFGPNDRYALADEDAIRTIIEAVPALGAPWATAVVICGGIGAEQITEGERVEQAVRAHGIQDVTLVWGVGLQTVEVRAGDEPVVVRTAEEQLFPEIRKSGFSMGDIPMQFVDPAYEDLPAAIETLLSPEANPEVLSAERTPTHVAGVTYHGQQLVIKTPTITAPAHTRKGREERAAFAERAQALLIDRDTTAEEGAELLLAYDLTDDNPYGQPYIVTERAPGKLFSELNAEELDAITPDCYEAHARRIAQMVASGLRLDTSIENFLFDASEGLITTIDYVVGGGYTAAEEFCFFLVGVFDDLEHRDLQNPAYRTAAARAFERGLEVLYRLYPEVRTASEGRWSILQPSIKRARRYLNRPRP